MPPAKRLLLAAEQLFGERSYRRTTVADICAEAGMATGSFYAHFASKSDIFTAVIRQINADLRQAMAAALRLAEDNQRARERAGFRALVTSSVCDRQSGQVEAGCPTTSSTT